MVLAQGELIVKVVEARGLVVPSIPGFFGILCPYVTLKVKDSEKRTRMIDNTKDPVFGEKFVFQSRLDETDILLVQVWNHREKDDTKMGHPLIGEITVPLDEVVSGKTDIKKIQYTVVDHVGQPKGKIHLELSWTESEDILDKLLLNKLVGDRPWYLRTEDYYELVKSAYNYGKGFPIARSVTPIAENVAEKILLKAGVRVENSEESNDNTDPSSPEPIVASPETPTDPSAPEADQEKALKVVDETLKNFLKTVDEIIDTKKDGIITGTKLRKNKTKFRMVDTACYTGEFLKQQKDNVGQNISKGKEYVKGRKDVAFQSTTEQVQAISQVVYEVIQPYAQKFPIVGKYFEEAQELAMEAAEAYDAGLEVKEKLEDLGILPEDDEVTDANAEVIPSTSPKVREPAISSEGPKSHYALASQGQGRRLERTTSDIVYSSPEHTPYAAPRMAQSEAGGSPRPSLQV